MPKNIVFVLSDQHRKDAVSLHNPNLITPNFERLKNEGVCFTNCFCGSQACIASRASIMTGQYAEVHGLWGIAILPQNYPTWPGYFSRHGYQTVCVGRTHHIDLGFDNKIRVPSGNSYPMNNHDPRMQNYWQKDAYVGPSPAPFEDYYETKITRTAIEFLREMKRSAQPFILYVGYLAPHAPITPPNPYWDMYEGITAVQDEVDPPEDYLQSPDIQKMLEVNEYQHRKILQGYYGLVSTVDACIGLLLDELDNLGLSQDTLFIYTSDHGDQLGHRKMYNKCRGYDPSINVPLFIRCPGTVKENTINNALIEQIDFVPTMCEATGTEIMKSAGKSFWDICRDGREKHREIIYSSCNGNATQIFRDSEWKWIHRMAEDKSVIDEIYNLREDPEEHRDVTDPYRIKPVKDKFLLHLQELSLKHFRSNVSDFFPEARQPRLIPFFST